MRVLVAPDAVTDAGVTVGAIDVGGYLAQGWAAARPADEIVVHPSSTGAHGFLEVLRAARGGEQEAAVARDAWGAAAPAAWLRLGRTAYVEAAPLLGDPASERAADLARDGSSAGVGDLVLAAVRAGATRVVIGLGESGSHDAGLGMLRVLAGAGAEEPAARVTSAAAAALAGVEVIVAAATDRPLTGLSGAGAALAGRPGVDATLAQEVELALSGPVAQIEAAAVRQVSLLTPQPTVTARRAGRLPYGGAGGGVAFALAALGARVLPGAEVVAVETALAAEVRSADLALTATSVLDGESLAVGVPGVVGRLALAELVPAVGVAPLVRLGRRELSGTGLEAVYPLIDPAPPGKASAAVALDVALSQRASRVARTWSR